MRSDEPDYSIRGPLSGKTCRYNIDEIETLLNLSDDDRSLLTQRVKALKEALNAAQESLEETLSRKRSPR